MGDVQIFGAAKDSPASMETMLVSAVSSYAIDTSLVCEQLRQHKEQCMERLRCHKDQEGTVRYAEQAILANLGWGMDAIEEASQTRHEGTKRARLEYAEKMLQVCAFLDVRATTTGVPNSYLSSLAHLSLAFLWMLRNDDRTAAQHMMDSFVVDPFHSRVDFAPALWERLFLPHLNCIMTWYFDQRQSILSRWAEPEGEESFSRDDDFCAGQSLLSKVNTPQAEQLQKLEFIYQDSLDGYTRRYARYYRDWLTLEFPKESTIRLPIVNPPTTHWQQLSDSQKLLELDNSQKLLVHSTSPQDAPDNPELPTLEEDIGFSLKRLSSVSSEGFIGKDVFLTLSCNNPIWKEDDGSKAGAWKENSSLNMSWAQKMESISISSYNVACGMSGHDAQISVSRKDKAVQETAQILPSQRTQAKSNSPDLQEKEQYNDDEFCTISSSEEMCWKTNLVFQSLHESCLSISSDMDTELEMQDAASHSSTVKPISATVRSRHYSNLIHGKHTEEDTKDNAEDKVVEHSFKQAACSSCLVDDEKPSVMTTLPKDFLCPITGHIFNDPVTLETGQTYERKAVQEWLDHGHYTCPITGQILNSGSLPKTNYVLKGLVGHWKEMHDISQEFSSSFSGPQMPIVPFVKNRGEEGLTDALQGSPCSTDECRVDFSLSDALQGSPSSTDKCRVDFSLRTDALQGSPCSTDECRVDFSLRTPAGPQLVRVINDLKQALYFLCTSEDLQECEESVMIIKDIWLDAKENPNLKKYLIKADVIDSFIEILSNSESTCVWSGTMYVLSGLMKRDKSVKASILMADPELECIFGLLKRGVAEAAVLLHQLEPSVSQMSKLDLIPFFVDIIKTENSAQELPFSMNPKTAALKLLCQLVSRGKSSKLGTSVQRLISSNPVVSLIDCMDTKIMEERLDAVTLLLICMQEDGSCRDFIAQKADLALVLDFFHIDNSKATMVALSFLSELVRLNRRTVNNRILRTLKDGGLMSSMHVLLVHLQLAPPEQRPLTAGLLLQLDLLAEPRGPSMYRDEAVEALIEALNCKESPATQAEAAETLVALIGHFSSSGKPLTEAFLLRIADLEEGSTEYSEAVQSQEYIPDKDIPVEEDAKAEWEKKVAKALLGYEQGSILVALSHNMRSEQSELSKPCIIVAVWLLMMVPQLPDTGLKTVANQNLLDPFWSIFKFSKKTSEQGLAALALHNLLKTTEVMQHLATNAEDTSGPLRKMQKSALVAEADTWAHTDIGEIDLHKNGAIKAFARARKYIFSGHSDGTIKVWDGKKRLPSFIHETKKHTKSVTSLAVSQSTDRLHSGSQDRSIRVWTLGLGEIQCIHVIKQKEPVNGLIVNGSLLCVVPQGTGVQVQQETGNSNKELNLGKRVQSIAYSAGKIYCGCSDNSIQELDMKSASSLTIQAGTRTLFGKTPIYALKVFGNCIYAAGASIDGAALKVWSQADKSLVRALKCAPKDIRAMVVNVEFLYLGTNSGAVEVWQRERLCKVASFSVGSKITCFLLKENIIFCGSENGKMRILANDSNPTAHKFPNLLM
ncbi:hypothetical protein O6H91_Y306000 [Diphasiastrum complanatum]|nr:hypothetical protein O6H91_Y306000 [Diphasiastrum complanatum]